MPKSFTVPNVTAEPKFGFKAADIFLFFLIQYGLKRHLGFPWNADTSADTGKLLGKENENSEQ